MCGGEALVGAVQLGVVVVDWADGYGTRVGAGGGATVRRCRADSSGACTAERHTRRVEWDSVRDESGHQVERKKRRGR